jgi:hypothetical protein
MNIEEKLRLVKTWCVIHLDILKKFKKHKFSEGQKFFASSDDYSRLFLSLIKFFIPPQTQEALCASVVFESTLLTECGNINYDIIVNEIKSKALTCLKMIWTYLFKKKPKKVYSTGNVYVQGANQMAPVMMNTLIYLGSLRDPNRSTLESLT